MGATTSSNATIPVADPGEGPAPLPPYFYPPPPPPPISRCGSGTALIQKQGEGTKYYPEFMVHENVNVTMYPIKQLSQLRPRGAVFPVWEMTVKM